MHNNWSHNKTDITCWIFFFFSSRRRHTRCSRDWSSDVCSSDLLLASLALVQVAAPGKERTLCCLICIPSFTVATHRCQSSVRRDRKSTRLNSSHGYISYAVFCLKKKKNQQHNTHSSRITEIQSP